MPPRCSGDEDDASMLLMKRFAVAVLITGVAAGCSGSKDEKPAADASTPAASAAVPPVTGTPASAADASAPEAASPYDALPEAVRSAMDKPFTGDFDAEIARRMIRVGVTFNRTHYFIDKGQQRGLTYESLKLFEDELNAERKTGNLKINVVFVPLPRDQLYPALINGKVDMVAAMGLAAFASALFRG